MTNLIISYEWLLDPINLIEQLDTDEKFIEWLNKGTIKDLQCTLSNFEAKELYEHCRMIKGVIDAIEYEEFLKIMYRNEKH